MSKNNSISLLKHFVFMKCPHCVLDGTWRKDHLCNLHKTRKLCMYYLEALENLYDVKRFFKASKNPLMCEIMYHAYLDDFEEWWNDTGSSNTVDEIAENGLRKFFPKHESTWKINVLITKSLKD